MHKYIMICICFVISLSVAQEQPSLYLQKRLTIEVENSIIASYADWDAFLTESIRFGKADLVIRKSKKWESYRGGIKIAESQFYEIAGFAEQARIAKKYKSKRNLLSYGGLALALVGAVFFYPELINSQVGYECNISKMIIGAGAMVVGFGVSYSGFHSPAKMSPATFAVEVTDDYNKRLKRSLQQN
ncbi:hypothetical protein ES705_12555 [subsurface metagenome]|jgi:hypothetical protein